MFRYASPEPVLRPRVAGKTCGTPPVFNKVRVWDLRLAKALSATRRLTASNQKYCVLLKESGLELPARPVLRTTHSQWQAMMI